MATMKTMATVKSYENEVNENYSITSKTGTTRTTTSSSLTMHNKFSNDDVDFDDWVAHNMHWVCTHCAFVPQLWLSHTSHSMAQVLSAFTLPSAWSSMAHSLWLASPFLFPPLPPVYPRLPLPPRAVPWAPLHDRHGKPALLRCRRERTPWTPSPLTQERGDCYGRTMWPIVCADKIVDENTYTFDRWSCARRSIVKVPRTSGKVITTKSCE